MFFSQESSRSNGLHGGLSLCLNLYSELEEDISQQDISDVDLDPSQVPSAHVLASQIFSNYQGIQPEV